MELLRAGRLLRDEGMGIEDDIVLALIACGLELRVELLGTATRTLSQGRRDVRIWWSDKACNAMLRSTELQGSGSIGLHDVVGNTEVVSHKSELLTRSAM